MWTYLARCDRVIDGDTFDCIIDLGFKVSIKVRIRVDGIDTPERKDHARWTNAQRVLNDLLTEAGTFQIVTRKVPEKYGRWLGTVTMGNNYQIDLASTLISLGVALPWHGSGPHPTFP